jgi:hypothetical protein
VPPGAGSADPPYTVPEVLGTPLSERLKAALSELGFNDFRPGALGFSASRR